MQNAIAADRLYVEVDLPKLADADLDDLKAILLGKKTTDYQMDMKRAVNALSQSDRSKESAGILAGILADEKQPSKTRAITALNLGAFPHPEAEDALIGQLTSKDPMVQAAVIKSLGRGGSAKAINALKKIQPANERLRKLASFAETAIGFRSKSSSLDVSLPDIAWNDFKARTIQGEAVRQKIGKVWGATYGIGLSPEIAVEFQCGSVKHCIFLNDALKQGAFTRPIKAEKMIAGLVVQDDSPSHLTIRYLILSFPTKDGISLAVLNNDGDVQYAGQIVAAEKGLHFKLRDIGLSGTPTEVEGLLTDDKLEVGFRAWKTGRMRKRHGEAILP